MDARNLDGKPVVLFGPFALATTKFLKHGSWFDLFSSVTHDNLVGMLRVGIHNLDLVKYLLQQAELTDEDRYRELQAYFPQAKREDWRLVTAGQRVQVIKRDPEKGAVLQFGTEIVTDADGTIAALMGASAGASTAPYIMLNLMAKAFPQQMTDAGWKPRLQKIIPSYGRKINESAATTNEIRRMTSAALHLPYLDVPADLSPSATPPAAPAAVMPAALRATRTRKCRHSEANAPASRLAALMAMPPARLFHCRRGDGLMGNGDGGADAQPDGLERRARFAERQDPAGLRPSQGQGTPSGSRQASATCRPLSRAKFMTKSQAMGSCVWRSRWTTTHFTPFMVVGTHQGGIAQMAAGPGAAGPELAHDPREALCPVAGAEGFPVVGDALDEDFFRVGGNHGGSGGRGVESPQDRRQALLTSILTLI